MPIDDDPYILRDRRRPPWRGIVIAIVIAFAAGLVAMALVLHYRGGWLPWVQPAATTAVPAKAAHPPNATTAPAGPIATGADYGALAAREAVLAARLSDLEARTATIDTQASAASGNATRAEGLLIAFAARRALDRGLGLGYIEGQLRARFGATQPRAVATVIQAARAPVTIEDLRLGLDSIGPDLVSSGAHGDWWAALRNSMSNLIVLRKAGSPSPRPSSRLLSARHLLEGGQVEAALAEVSQLPGASKAQRWTAAARRYIDSRHALDVIETAAIIGQSAQPDAAPSGAAPALPSEEAAQPAAAAPSN